MVTPPTNRPPARAPAARAPSAKPPDDDLTPEEQAAIDAQRHAFNVAAAEHAELLRELNVMRDMATAQRKHDDDVLKAFIRMI